MLLTFFVSDLTQWHEFGGRCKERCMQPKQLLNCGNKRNKVIFFKVF